MMKVVALFDNFGPYHYARLGELATTCELLAVEIFGVSDEYSWDSHSTSPLHVHTLSDQRLKDSMILGDLGELIDKFDPDAIFIPGYYRLIHLHLALKYRKKLIFLFSESQAIDFKRNSFVEFIKGSVLNLFDGVLVGGSRHAHYLSQLRFPMERVESGYDVVDNAYFFDFSCKTPSSLVKAPPYFLTIARLVPKKNLDYLLREYKQYVDNQSRLGIVPLDLRILGDGPLECVLKQLVSDLGLAKSVHMHGFVQYQEIPAYMYAADALVHPSSSEQWGLVVNEAMCCGLPVIVSNRVGSSADLVVSGGNGFVFDPLSACELSKVLSEFSDLSGDERAKFSAASRGLIKDWSLARFSGSVNKLMLLSKRPQSLVKFMISVACYGFYYCKELLNIKSAR